MSWFRTLRDWLAKLKAKEKPESRLFAAAFIIAMIVGVSWLAIFLTRVPNSGNQYAWQAQAFWQGRVDVPLSSILDQCGLCVEDFNIRDYRFYWIMGPLPAVALMPLVLVTSAAKAQIALQFILLAATAWITWRTCRRFGLSAQSSRWATAALIFGSIFIGTAVYPNSWGLGHVMTVLLFMAAIHEYLGKRRPFVIGLFCGLLYMIRSIPGLALAAFYGLTVLLDVVPWREKFRRAMYFAVPVLTGILAMGAFNWARFGDFSDSGYADNLITTLPLTERREKYGLFHYSNIPRNFFYFFLKLPIFVSRRMAADGNGLSFFIMSPVFLQLFRRRRRLDAEFWSALVASLGALAILLCYFGTGWAQIGPRYLFDILPLLFLMLLGVWRDRGLGEGTKALILLSMMINLFIITGTFAIGLLHVPAV